LNTCEINKLIIVNDNIKYNIMLEKFCNNIGLITKIKKLETGFIVYNVLIDNQKINFYRNDFEFIK
jgi:hypothetical protein